jgi:membrane protein
VTIPPPIQRMMDRLLHLPPVMLGQRVVETFGRAGGGLLAGGLTYSALFALLPGLLLLTGIIGIIVDDPARRAAIVENIGVVLPPLEDFLAVSLEQITEGAVGFGILGLVGLAWGASRFYAALDDAFARIFHLAPKRNFVVRTIRGIVSVVLLVTVFVTALFLTGVVSVLATEAEAIFGDQVAVFWRYAPALLAAVVFVVGVALIYRIVPARSISWSAVWLPALVVGIVLALLTQLFSFIAPRMIGAAAVYGAFVAVFVAMIWLSTAFQILLMGAAWLRERIGPPAPPFIED